MLVSKAWMVLMFSKSWKENGADNSIRKMGYLLGEVWISSSLTVLETTAPSSFLKTTLYDFCPFLNTCLSINIGTLSIT